MPFDPDDAETARARRPVSQEVSAAPPGAFTGAANFSVSDNGTLAYVQGPATAAPP